MSRFQRCPKCGHEASGGFFGGVYVYLHKCRRKGHYFCNNCKNGDRCPFCGTDDVSWNAEAAYTKR